jgi:predicted permease
MLQDYRLGLRMLLKYPGLTLAGGLAIAIAIGIGAGWYDLSGKLFAPAIPLPDGDRLVLIETQNTLTNAPESRVARDFIEWRRALRTIEELGAFRTYTRNLIVGNAPPEPIQMAELTTTAFAAAHMPPALGRGLLASDEVPGAPGVVVIGYKAWQRFFGGRRDIVGSIVKLGNTPATVIGVMPEGFGYPMNQEAWMPLSLRASYRALVGGAIGVIGRLVAGVTRDQANAELHGLGLRTAALLPATHAYLRPRVVPLGRVSDLPDLALFTMTNLPVLMVLLIACTSVGTLVYARTATREGEIAVRSSLGASRARIVGQLFVEALVLASIAAAVGLVAADRVLTWGIEGANRSGGGAPFWMTGGLTLSTIVYAGVLAVVSAAMLSVLPGLRATRARVQANLANLGAGGATLRFGRVWTGAMIAQVALTAIGIPVAMETASEVIQKLNIRAAFPSGEYVAARIDLDRPFDEEYTPAFAERRAQSFTALERAVAQEPGVVAVTFADRAPGSLAGSRFGEVESIPGSGPAYDDEVRTLAVGPRFFEVLERPIVAGRGFNSDDWSSTARTVIVNEAFARAFLREAGIGSPLGARVRYPADAARGQLAPGAEPGDETRQLPRDDAWFEIVGVVRDVGLYPDDSGDELPFVFHTASAGTASPLVMTVRTRGNPASLAARLPVIAADVDAGLFVREARPLVAWVRERDDFLSVQAWALAAVSSLVLLLSALGIFSLVSVSVSRRTREIGLRAALGANPRHVLGSVVSRAVVLMSGGIVGGGALLLLAVALGQGPSGRPAEDVVLFTGYLGVTSAVMLAACLLACLGPASRALRINPIDALREC